MSVRRPDLSRTTRVIELQIADDPDAWASAGFTVQVDSAGPRIDLGGPVLRLLGRSGDSLGVIGWTIAAAGTEARCDLDGLPTTFVRPGGTERAEPHPVDHPNGAHGLDHIVITTPDLDRTITAFEALGVPCRRIRDAGTTDHPLRQGFFKFGPVTIEIVSDDRDAGSDPAVSPSRWWGLALDAEDLDRTRAVLGPDGCSEARPAVQPGRRIATLRHRRFGLSVRLAVLDHHEDRSTDVVDRDPPDPTTRTGGIP